jgi:hypothetical protein
MKEPVGSFEKFISALRIKQGKKEPEFEYFYRGHSSCKHELIPSIYRPVKMPLKRVYLVQREDNMFKEIILRTPGDFINEKTTLEKLVKMQHYGLPTRLLDITSNPLVALFFACGTPEEKEKKDDDGEVLIFKIPIDQIKYYDSDTVSVIANLSQMPIDFDNHILLHKIQDEKPQFTIQYDINTFNQVLPVKVKLSNNRILKQSGLFYYSGLMVKRQFQQPYDLLIVLRFVKQVVVKRTFAIT